MSDHQAILFSNEAFYQAFAERDMDAMDAIWADDDAVACIHPGWQPLEGREAVLESWRAILSNADSPPSSAARPAPTCAARWPSSFATRTSSASI